MGTRSKHFVLLEAYEDLTRKETFCLGEENFDGVLKAQAKKAKISDELARLNREAPLDSAERADFDARTRELLEVEEANRSKIEVLMRDNREAYKELSKQGKSASKFRRTYGKSSDDSSGSLEGRA